MYESEFVSGGMVSKVDRYGWTLANSPGHFQWLDKRTLRIDERYQRSAQPHKVQAFAQNWNWQACGVLHVSFRDGFYWVFDGGHRLMAALKRVDIKELPCMIFACEQVSQEASGFLAVNSHRRPVTTLEKHNARIVAGDPLSVVVSEAIAACGLVVTKKANAPGQIKCLETCMKIGDQSDSTLRRVLPFAAAICTADSMPVKKDILIGLWSVDRWCVEQKTGEKANIAHPRLADRIRKIGARKLLDAMARAAAIASNRSDKVLGGAIVLEVNKGLHNKFDL
jgi:hypothetical protein